MGCADSTDEKVEETPKTLEEQLEDKKKELEFETATMNDNDEAAGTVDEKKAAVEEAEKPYKAWNEGIGQFWKLDIEVDKKRKKQLKKAQKLGSEETFDAREHQPCVIFGIDEDNFSQEAWNAGLDVDEEGWVMPKEGLFNTIEVDF